MIASVIRELPSPATYFEFIFNADGIKEYLQKVDQGQPNSLPPPSLQVYSNATKDWQLK